MTTHIYSEGRISRPVLAARLLATVIAALLTFALAALPTILPAAEVPTARVQVSDLNLGSVQGQRALERRVEAAIERVCAPSSSELARHAIARRKADECRRSAWKDVQLQLAAFDLPRLAAASTN